MLWDTNQHPADARRNWLPNYLLPAEEHAPCAGRQINAHRHAVITAHPPPGAFLRESRLPARDRLTATVRVVELDLTSRADPDERLLPRCISNGHGPLRWPCLSARQNNHWRWAGVPPVIPYMRPTDECGGPRAPSQGPRPQCGRGTLRTMMRRARSDC